MARTSLIEAYLEQLAEQLPRTAHVEDVIAEVEDHLQAIVAAHLSLGLSEEAAAHHALGSFGSADLVARAFAQQRGDTAAMPTTFTTSAGLAAMLGGLILGICLSLASFTTLDVGSTSPWYPPVALGGGVLTAIGLLGIDVRHRARYGAIGPIARLLVPVGLVGLFFSVMTWFAPGWVVFMAAIILGLLGLGIEVWRGGVVARGAVALTGVGIAGIPLATLFGIDTTTTWTTGAIAGTVGAAVLAAGLLWLGHGLWRERAVYGTSRGGRPTATA